MSPKHLPTRAATKAEAVGRRRIAEKYLEVAELAEVDDGAAINVAVAIAVLAGIAAGDALCAVAIGQRYSGRDHVGAAELLRRVDRSLGDELRVLVALKSASHYGDTLLGSRDRSRALRAARRLVEAARQRAG